MVSETFIEVADRLNKSGLIWHPEIGDEIALRPDLNKVSILVDPHGLTPTQLRGEFLWLPTVEQMVEQIEARQALIYHVGVNEKMFYEAIIRTMEGMIEICEINLRIAFGKALHGLLTGQSSESSLQ